MKISIKYKKLFIAFLIPALLLLMFNATAFKHYHILSNGQVIEHSHPLSNSSSPIKNHHHSKTEVYK